VGCELHGNWTQKISEGKARQLAANTKHGNETQVIRAERSVELAELYKLEMLGENWG
jgi:hypothetical protein